MLEAGKKIRIVLVDDHQMLREGLRVMLQKQADLAVVNEAADVRSAVECVLQTRPDIVVMDVHLPDGTGISAVRQILAELPDMRIVMLSGSPEPELINEAMSAGAAGFVLKDKAAQDLAEAIRIVVRGQVCLCPSSATLLAAHLRESSRSEKTTVKPQLSDRELQVLKYVVEGLRNKEMASNMGISTKSVETYRKRLLTKLQCSSTAELVRYAVREGLAAA